MDGVCCAYPGENGTCCTSTGKSCCPPSKPLYLYDGSCVVCDDVTQTRVNVVHLRPDSIDPCQRCQNRVEQGAVHDLISWCVAPCPTDNPIRSYDGTCYPCDSEELIQMGDWMNYHVYSVETCYQCPNRVMWFRYCAPACPDGTVAQDGQCVCPEAQPLLDINGVCHDCSEENSFAIGNFESSKCADTCDGSSEDRPLRKSYSGGNKKWCAKADCGAGNTYNNVYSCVSCAQESNFNVANNTTDKARCEADCAGVRYLDGTTCKKCPSGDNATALTEAQCQACGLVWSDDSCGE